MPLSINETGKYITGLINQKRFSEADAAIDALEAEIPLADRHRLLGWRSQVRWEQGFKAAALNFIRSARAAEPRFLAHAYWTAVMEFELALYADAEETLRSLIQNCGEYGDSFYMGEAQVRLIVCLKAMGRVAEAEQLKKSVDPQLSAYIGGELIEAAHL